MDKTPGSLSPFQTSSSQHDEENDNYLEYYVEGGEKMTDKTFELNDSTEPDPKSELAMQKESTYTKPATVEGEGTFSTTANTTTQAPKPGATTEPDSMHKNGEAECCDNACGRCEGPGCGCCSDCQKMEKAAGSTCDSCGSTNYPQCKKAMSVCKCGDMKKEAMPTALLS